MSEYRCLRGESTPQEKDCCRIKERSKEKYKSLVHLLNRIEGQVRGIRGMPDKLSVRATWKIPPIRPSNGCTGELKDNSISMNTWAG